MENVDKKNIGLPSRYINALYDLCDEAKNLKKLNWGGGFYRKDIGYKVIK